MKNKLRNHTPGWRLHWIFAPIFILHTLMLISQDANTIKQYITLDSITIRASQHDLDIDSFINYVSSDQSFYAAFKNLRSASYDFSNSIAIYSKSSKKTTTYHSLAHQKYSLPCRTMTETAKTVTGEFFEKSGEYRYYMAKLYDRLFFTHGQVCTDTAESEKTHKLKGMEKNVAELKKLMFSPGVEVRVPLLGHKTAIFDEELTQYYDYSIIYEELNQRPCYRFAIKLKPDFLQKKENKTVIKKLQTWFDQSTLQIVKRKYTLAGKTIAYSFEVDMDIDVISVGQKYFPSRIAYDGSWKIIGRQRENAKFVTLFSDISY